MDNTDLINNPAQVEGEYLIVVWLCNDTLPDIVGLCNSIMLDIVWLCNEKKLITRYLLYFFFFTDITLDINQNSADGLAELYPPGYIDENFAAPTLLDLIRENRNLHELVRNLAVRNRAEAYRKICLYFIIFFVIM